MAEGRIELLLRSNVKSPSAIASHPRASSTTTATEERVLRTDHAFVLIGAELPVKFLRSLGIRLENEWTGLGAALQRPSTLLTLLGLWSLFGGFDRLPWRPAVGLVGAGLGLGGPGRHRLPRRPLVLAGRVVPRSGTRSTGSRSDPGRSSGPTAGWGYDGLTFFDRGWSFWYTVIYTLLMTGFGIQAMLRWGSDRRKDKFQIWRYVSLVSFQWLFFFIIPEFLFQWAVEYQWLGPETLAQDPTFAEQAWRAYGIVYAWPLFFYTFFDDPHVRCGTVWGLLLTFVIMPLVIVIFLGKRYCSWICGCGGLGRDLRRPLAAPGPQGASESQRWEKMGLWILGFAAVATVLKLVWDIWQTLYGASAVTFNVYRIVVDVWLVGILPVTLYPFLGGKVWCRYWCPLAKMMELFSRFYAKLGISRFKITANDKCIGCNECSRNCQVGIDVMQYALKQEKLDNETSSCIGCGICVSVCPMDTLTFGEQPVASQATDPAPR